MIVFEAVLLTETQKHLVGIEVKCGLLFSKEIQVEERNLLISLSN